ncbi:MAG: IPT/TIG domain-containing protein [candidate division KSB1 bacterium]|nr:IPT/TIG domain-containing protein [candidate division KSB1 bacterium]MDZ7384606.1 IPT/TIG domain-containing protein [candidate division KSB1 bacterium]MDZ7392950.1 IPT/TIG domain-containing protein [candidate division KSB1 bacterium]MDZ7412093.1 IPT/TIG domain-containing protein [candidate division KSB1 bacterium]
MRRFACALVVGAVLVAAGLNCEKERPIGLYDPAQKYNPDPIITSLEPADSALAGLVTVTVNGQNFSPIAQNNFVYFGKTRVPTLEASPVRLVVKSPNVVADAIPVKVAVLGALSFSNVVNYKLVRGVFTIGGYGEFDEPYVVECDRDENVFVVLGSRNVEKITPAGEKQVYGTVPFSLPSGIKMGPGGYLYVGRRSTSFYRIPPGGGAAVKWITAPGRIDDFDFASDGTMYAGGKGDFLYNIKPDGSAAAVADYPNTYIRAVRVFEDYVYIGGRDDATGRHYVWRNRINPDGTLAPKEVYFDWGSRIDTTSEVQAITFAQDGDLYIGTNAPQAVVVVHRDGSFEPLYPGVLEPASNYLAWGNSNFLYICRRSEDPKKKAVLKVNMLKQGAPYYGRT